MSERFQVKDDPQHPNQAFVTFPGGYIEINGARAERERIAEVIAKALNAEDVKPEKGTEK